MRTLAILYRTAQLYAQAAHQLVAGPTFFADHDWLGGAYEAYAAAYDSLVERMIGLGLPELDLPALGLQAATAAAKLPATFEPRAIFAELLAQEAAICAAIKAAVPGATDGTANLLQGLADESEARQYKLRQRLV